ncbi:ROK family protein [Paenibacillus sp. JX-17]|uniref:ROK family protein n=1 Tax=Paenibacillus lacisoli TaxID=3064525 RepID=A0ABT9CC53_9BACL|nr:ROK family protein [Paenibacillus sp. JX-17]MDO7906844.1 ROK family protein [Paenibacillus sp. JX-17]
MNKHVQVIGIDLGGTSIKGIVADETGRILLQTRRPAEAARGREAILEQLGQLLAGLLEQAPCAAAIGAASAGRINSESGEVVYATDNLPGWQGLQLRDWIEQRWGLPAAVDNDANAALLGEAWSGAGRGLQDVVMLTLGTGVGGANLMQGRLLRGARWSGGEWGHCVLVPGGTRCNCGRRGCAEQYVSGTALSRLAREAGAPAEGRALFEAASRGEPAAAAVLGQYADALALLIGNIEVSLNPEVVILGGGVADSAPLWWRALEQALARARVAQPVRPAQLGNGAGSLGAAWLALERQQTVPVLADEKQYGSEAGAAAAD